MQEPSPKNGEEISFFFQDSFELEEAALRFGRRGVIVGGSYSKQCGDGG